MMFLFVCCDCRSDRLKAMQAARLWRFRVQLPPNYVGSLTHNLHVQCPTGRSEPHNSSACIEGYLTMLHRLQMSLSIE